MASNQASFDDALVATIASAISVPARSVRLLSAHAAADGARVLQAAPHMQARAAQASSGLIIDFAVSAPANQLSSVTSALSTTLSNPAMLQSIAAAAATAVNLSPSAVSASVAVAPTNPLAANSGAGSDGAAAPMISSTYIIIGGAAGGGVLVLVAIAFTVRSRRRRNAARRGKLATPSSPKVHPQLGPAHLVLRTPWNPAGDAHGPAPAPAPPLPYSTDIVRRISETPQQLQLVAASTGVAASDAVAPSRNSSASRRPSVVVNASRRSSIAVNAARRASVTAPVIPPHHTVRRTSTTAADFKPQMHSPPPLPPIAGPVRLPPIRGKWTAEHAPIAMAPVRIGRNPLASSSHGFGAGQAGDVTTVKFIR